MFSSIFRQTKQRLYSLLRWSEKYIKADMIYIVKGQFWLVLGNTIGVVGGVLLTVVFANFLEPETFGTYKYVLALAGFISAFTLGGMGGAVMRAVALGKRNVVLPVSRISAFWSLPAAFLAFTCAGYYFWNGNIILGAGLLLAALTIPLSSVFGLYKSIMIGNKDFKNLSLSSFRALIPVAGLITATLISGNILIIIATYFLLNILVSGSMYLWSIRKYRIVSEGANSEDIKDTARYGKHLSVMGAVSQASDSLDHLLLWHFAGPVQLATYVFALAPIRELRNFSQNIYPLVFPKFVVKTIAQMKETVPLRIKQFTLISVVTGLIYILFAPLLYTYVFPQYTNAVLLSQFLAVGLMLQGRVIIDAMLYTQSGARLRYITIGVTQGTKVLLWLILIPFYGMYGAVIGVLVAEVISALVAWWAYRKLSD